MSRDVSADREATSALLEESLKLQGSVSLSSATQQSADATALQRTEDLIAHLPSLRAAYLQVAPVTPQALILSR